MIRRDPWTPSEVDVFVAAVANTPMEAAWHLVAFTGLRVRDVLALRWPDIDAQAGLIRVESAVTGVPYAAVAVPPTIESARPIELDRALASVLEGHHRRQQAERSEWVAYYATSDLVICRENGRALPARSLDRACRQAAERAGLPPVGLPTLRRSVRRAALSRGAAS